MLLSQLNWGSPVHRVIEHLLMVRSKLFYVEGGGPDMWVFHEDHPGFMLFDDVHPRDLMYVTDPVERAGFSLPSAGGDLIHKIMAQIATYQRQFVWPIRRQRQYRYMQQFTDPAGYQEVLEHGHLAFDNPAFDHNYTDDPGSSPGLLEILDIDEARRTASDEYVDLLMDTPFKVRQTDPLIQVGDTMFRRLSELDPSYSRRKAEHAATVTKQYVARLHLEPEDRDLLKDTLAKIDQKWEAHLQQTRRLKPSELKALVRNSASHIHGRYSFMMFEPF
jgi:hypothetical protein